jgi:hypothetical protein
MTSNKGPTTITSLQHDSMAERPSLQPALKCLLHATTMDRATSNNTKKYKKTSWHPSSTYRQLDQAPTPGKNHLENCMELGYLEILWLPFDVGLLLNHE